MDVLKRLQAFKEELTDTKDKSVDKIVDALEHAFPEIADKEPFIKIGDIFMRRQYERNLYTLIEEGEGILRIHNIKENKSWSGKVVASNYGCLENPYLTRKDFNILAKASGASTNNIAIIPTEELVTLHINLFA